MDDDWRTGERMMFEYEDKIARRRLAEANDRVAAATHYGEFTAAYRGTAGSQDRTWHHATTTTVPGFQQQ